MLTADSLAKTIFSLASKGDTKDVSRDSVSYLKKKGALALLPRVISSLTRLIEKEASGNEIRIASAAIKKEALAAAEALGMNTENVQIVTDETLIGGYTLSKKGARVDTSYKSALLTVYRSVVRGK